MASQDKYNDGYTHEVLHTAHVLCDAWDRHVTETRCADQFPDVKAAAERAAGAMHDLYQLVGQKFEDDATDR
jgi:hypothetical protein